MTRRRRVTLVLDGLLLALAAYEVLVEARSFDGKDPVEFYLDDAMIHGTAESVADKIMSFGAEIGMTYLMAAPLRLARSGY